MGWAACEEEEEEEEKEEEEEGTAGPFLERNSSLMAWISFSS